MNEIKFGSTGFVHSTKEYEDALEAAGWHCDDFELFQQLEEEHGDGVSGDTRLDEKMDATPPALWIAMLETARAIDLENKTIEDSREDLTDVLDEIVAVCASGDQDLTSDWHQLTLKQIIQDVPNNLRRTLLCMLIYHINDNDGWSQDSVKVLCELLDNDCTVSYTLRIK